MTAFSGFKEVVDAELEGRCRMYNFRKVPTQSTSVGVWFDLSMSPGNPVPKYWFDAVPLTAKAITATDDGGIFHGKAVSPREKFLRSIYLNSTAVTTYFILCDYLLYYPSCDDSVLDPQVMDNTITLPRYTDGEGVMMMAVSIAARTGGQTFQVSYTNSKGVAGRLSSIVTQNTITGIGTIQSGLGTGNYISPLPFIPLQDGDTGVQKIDSVTMLGADVGLFSLILVKPLAVIQQYTNQSPVEKDFLLTEFDMPKIKDDAYLSFVANSANNLSAAVIMGNLKCIIN